MKRNRTILSALLPLLLAACSQGDILGTSSSNDDSNEPQAPLCILSAGLQSMADNATPATRASQPVNTLKAGTIGVFREQAAGYINAQPNVPYSYNATDGNWQSDIPANQILIRQVANVCAYYPYNNTYTDSYNIPLKCARYTGTVDDVTAYDAPGDICYATDRLLSGASASTSFSMKHAMSRLKLIFSRAADAGTAGYITSIAMKNPKLVSDAKLSIRTGSIHDETTPGKLEWNLAASPLKVPDDGTTVAFELLMVPGGLSKTKDCDFIFEVSGATMYATLPYATLMGFEAGKRHTIEFTISSSVVAVVGVTTQWIDAWAGAEPPAYNSRP